MVDGVRRRLKDRYITKKTPVGVRTSDHLLVSSPSSDEDFFDFPYHAGTEPSSIPLGRFFLTELAQLILHPKDKTLDWTYWLKNNPGSAPFWACLAGCCF